LIYSFLHRRSEFRAYESVPDRSRKMTVEGHRSLLGRFIVTSYASAIELGCFFASSKNFSVEIFGSG
jgi:hypothetical protein